MRNTGDSILYIRQHFVSTYKYKGPAFETTTIVKPFTCETVNLYVFLLSFFQMSILLTPYLLSKE